MHNFIPVLVLAALIFSSSPAVALDADVSAELEELANDPNTDAPGLAADLRVYVHEAVGEICKKQRQTTQVRCIMSRLLNALDGTGVLFEHCGALSGTEAVATCTVAGSEALPIVVALGRDPREDIDWDSVDDSYLRLRGALKDVARKLCASTHEPNESDCQVRKQAELLDLPKAAGARCAREIENRKQRCLDAFQTLAIYLRALRIGLNSSRPL